MPIFAPRYLGSAGRPVMLKGIGPQQVGNGEANGSPIRRCSRTAGSRRCGSASSQKTVRPAARSSRRALQEGRSLSALTTCYRRDGRCGPSAYARTNILGSQSCSAACRPSRRRSRSPIRPRGSPGPSWSTAASTRPAIAPRNIERMRARLPDKRLGDGVIAAAWQTIATPEREEHAVRRHGFAEVLMA